MGCYAPAPVATPAILEEIHNTCLQPTIDGMRRDGKRWKDTSSHIKVIRLLAFFSLDSC
jgi:hypothetical protein